MVHLGVSRTSRMKILGVDPLNLYHWNKNCTTILLMMCLNEVLYPSFTVAGNSFFKGKWSKSNCRNISKPDNNKTLGVFTRGRSVENSLRESACSPTNARSKTQTLKTVWCYRQTHTIPTPSPLLKNITCSLRCHICSSSSSVYVFIPKSLTPFICLDTFDRHCTKIFKVKQVPNISVQP